MPEDMRVKCGQHGKRNGYIVCIHVMDHTAIADRIVPATRTELGELVCGPCGQMAQGQAVDTKKFRLVCDQCAVVHGLFPSPKN